MIPSIRGAALAAALMLFVVLGPVPGPSQLPQGDVVMTTDTTCYRPGDLVHITATGWAGVPSIGDFPQTFWAIANASGDPIFETANFLQAVGSFSGTLEGTWNQTYRRVFGGQPPTGTPVPPGTYVIWFYELTPPNETPPDWVVPATIEIGDCGGGLPAETVTVRLVPRTLNLKSEGKWVTAHVSVANATAADIDPATLTLQGVSVDWSHITSNDTLMAKFDRAAFASTVAPGDAVVVTLVGRWTDGGSFTATDTIRVIQPGR